VTSNGRCRLILYFNIASNGDLNASLLALVLMVPFFPRARLGADTSRQIGALGAGAAAARNTSGADEWQYSREVMLSDEDVVVAELIGELDLLQRLVVRF